jgi:hypothetical protein
MTKKPITYPFRPKSTSVLVAGQFWAIPLPDGRFACGRVLQLNGSTIPTKSRAFFGGVQDWIGDNPPTHNSIAGAPILDFGVMHIRAITELGGEVLGIRDLQADCIQLPTLLSAMGGTGAMILLGSDALREAHRDEWGKLPVLGYWGWDFAQSIAVTQLLPRPVSQ